ncbi:MAG: hypothetical protein ABIQ90_17350 [Polaromonas sp.]
MLALAASVGAAVLAQDKHWVAQLVKLYQSEPIRQFVHAESKSAVVSGF